MCKLLSFLSWVKLPFSFPRLQRFCFVCFVWFPSGSAGIIGCGIMRSKKFDVIAVDELDTMHLEADLTDAIVSADAASVINNVLLCSRLLQQLPWGKGCRTMGSSIPSRKGAVDDRGLRHRHETVAHFGHPRIGRPGFETCAHLGDTMLGKLTLAMRPRAPRHTKRAGHGFGAIEARVLERRGREVAEVIPCDGADGAHDFPLTLIGNKKSAKQLLPDFDKLIPFDAPNHDDSNDLFNDLVKLED